MDIRPVTVEAISPRKDMPEIAAQLAHALKLKPCACERAWGKDGYAVVKACSGCIALERYHETIEAIT